jgi:hypothetical protein
MMRNFLIACLCFLFLSGFSIMDGGEITEENIHLLDPTNPDNANLPKSDDPLWDTLMTSTVAVDGETSRYKISFSDAVQSLNGKKIKISGFMMPLEATETFSHVLLSRKAPTCFFCLPGGPNEMIEVYTEKPIAWSDNMVTFEGVLKIVKDEETGMVYIMEKASLR